MNIYVYKQYKQDHNPYTFNLHVKTAIYFGYTFI